jgi:hypothetical protein
MNNKKNKDTGGKLMVAVTVIAFLLATYTEWGRDHQTAMLVGWGAAIALIFLVDSGILLAVLQDWQCRKDHPLEERKDDPTSEAVRRALESCYPHSRRRFF